MYCVSLHRRTRTALAVAILAGLALAAIAGAPSSSAQPVGLYRDLPTQSFASSLGIPRDEVTVHREALVTWPAGTPVFIDDEDAWLNLLLWDEGSTGSGWVWLSGTGDDGVTHNAAYIVTISGGLAYPVFKDCGACTSLSLPAGVAVANDLGPIIPLPGLLNTLPATGSGGLLVEAPGNNLSFRSVLIGATIIAILTGFVVLRVRLPDRRPRFR